MLLNYLSRIKDYLSQNYILSRILTLLLALGIIVLLFVFIWGGQANKDKEVSLPLAVEKEDKTVLASNQNEDNKNHKNQVAEKILVDLKGAVQKEGVYHLKPGSRVTDLIQEAGGLTEEADRNAINLAQKLKDEEVIYIAKKGENPQGVASSSKATISKTGNPSQPDNKKVNLNNASLEELTKIPGIGEKRAKEIIENRDKLGGFKSLDDLLAISGIGQKTLDKLKDDVEVD